MILPLLLLLPIAAQAPPHAKSTPVADPDKKVCRRVETTGSIMPGRSVCHRRAEWADIDDANAKAVSAASAQRGAGMSQN